jgi:hypothetical protein
MMKEDVALRRQQYSGVIAVRASGLNQPSGNVYPALAGRLGQTVGVRARYGLSSV